MKLRVRNRPGAAWPRLRARDAVLKQAVVDAASEALRDELHRHANVAVAVADHGERRAVGSADPVAAAREFGTLEQPASPWLAPLLPLVREPMRAAADSRMREIFAAHAGKSDAAARALSMRKS